MMKNALLQYKINKMQKQNDYSIMSSVSGAIKQMLMVFRNGDNYSKVVSELISKLPKHTQIFIWVNENNKKELRTLLKEMLPSNDWFDYTESKTDIAKLKDRRCIIISGRDIDNINSIWIRDDFIILKNSRSAIELVENQNHSYNKEISEILLSKKIVSSIQDKTKHKKDNWFFLDGGNILSDEDFILIGDNHYRELKEKLEELKPMVSFQTQSNDVTKEYLRKVLFAQGVFRKGTQPRIIPIGIDDTLKCSTAGDLSATEKKGIFDKKLWTGIKDEKFIPEKFGHIDMFISLTGEHDQKGKYIILMANVIELKPRHKSDAKVLNCYLSEIAKNLKNHGFTIIRNPIPLIPDDNHVVNFHAGMYNNCIIERIDNINKTVWLPSYLNGSHLDELDLQELERIYKCNEDIWRKLKFHIETIDANFYKFSESRGALRCMTLELKRIHSL